MSKPILFRTWVQNKKVVHRNYFAGSEDPETVKVKNEILKKFPGEEYPYPMQIWGVKMEGNKYSVHVCSPRPEHDESSKVQNSLLLNKDFIKYFYDMDTGVKTIEVVYKDGAILPVVSVPSNLTVRYITDMCNSDFELQNTQAIYVHGTVEDMYTWAESLKADIVMPISKDKKLSHNDDLFKFQFNNNKELVEVTGCFHLERYQVYGNNQEIYTEFTADYADELTNLSDTEIVVANTDNHGNRIAANVNKADIKEYIKVPKSDGSGGYDKVLLKDL